MRPLCLARLGVGARDEHAPLRVLGAARPHLLAGHHPLVAVLDRARLQRRQVRAGVGLGEALAPDLLGGEDRRQVALLLLVGAPHHQRRAAEQQSRACWPPAARARGRSLRSRSPIRSAWRRGRRTRSATPARPSRRRTGAAASRAARRTVASSPPSAGSGSGGLSASHPRSSSRKAVSSGLKVRSIALCRKPIPGARRARAGLRRRERR